MKKILLYAITTVFALTLGVSYANAGGKELWNGVTDFSGRTYDTLSDITMAAQDSTRNATMEGSHAGGPRTPISDQEFSNGITDFSGRTYDSL